MLMELTLELAARREDNKLLGPIASVGIPLKFQASENTSIYQILLPKSPVEMMTYITN